MKAKLSRDEKRLIFNWIWQSGLFLLILTPVFFILAKDWAWTGGWIFIILLWLFMVSHPLVLLPINPQLLAERERGMRAEGTKKWDQVLVCLASIAWFSTWLLAAIDHRLGWSRAFHPMLVYTGAVGTGLGFAIFILALSTNAFFAEGVRIQTERGHQVCDRGPYRVVRHPGYAGNILAILFIPLLLGSAWAFIPAATCAIFFIIRTGKEDAMLITELNVYRKYTEATRCRLFPGIW